MLTMVSCVFRSQGCKGRFTVCALEMVSLEYVITLNFCQRKWSAIRSFHLKLNRIKVVEAMRYFYVGDVKKGLSQLLREKYNLQF